MKVVPQQLIEQRKAGLLAVITTFLSWVQIIKEVRYLVRTHTMGLVTNVSSPI